MEFLTKLLIESWTLYAAGVVIVAARFASRRMKLGKWSALEIDDYLMLFALVNFTGVVISINEVAKNGSNYMAPEAAAALTPEGVHDAIYGSIMTFVLEIFTLTATWTIKACLLILYSRLTRNTLNQQHLLVNIAAGYCAFTYVIVTLFFLFLWCHPTYEYWAVPVRIEQCASYYHHMIFATACNISSDLLLLVIPVPIIMKTRLPRKRKIILILILGVGVFNILAAILNRYYNFSNPNSYVFLYWYVAEVGIAVLVGNLPLCWPVLRFIFGISDKTETPAYHGRSISSGPRKFRKPKDILTTAVRGDTTWDNLDDQEEGPAHRKTSSSSHHGSQIELILQGKTPTGAQHEVSAARDLTDRPVPCRTSLQQQMPPVSLHPHERQQGGRTRNGGVAGDKIMVVTTVDVSSSDPRR